MYNLMGALVPNDKVEIVMVSPLLYKSIYLLQND
jgi:hypothetical protein